MDNKSIGLAAVGALLGGGIGMAVCASSAVCGLIGAALGGGAGMGASSLLQTDATMYRPTGAPPSSRTAPPTQETKDAVNEERKWWQKLLDYALAQPLLAFLNVNHPDEQTAHDGHAQRLK